MANLIVSLSNLVLSLTRGQKVAILLAVDLALIPLSLAASVWLNPPTLAEPGGFGFVLAMMLVAGGGLSLALGLPLIKLNAYEQRGILRTATFAALVAVVGWLCLQMPWGGGLDTPVMVTFAMVLIIMSVSARLALRSLLVAFYRRGTSRVRVLIYGAGQTGVQLAAALGTDDAVEPVAFADDNPTLQNMTVAGLPVFPTIRLEELLAEKRIERVVLAVPTISRPKQLRIVSRLERAGVEVGTLPSFASLVGEGSLIDRIQPVDPNDYLNRADLDDDLMHDGDIYTGKSVMITGAGGSIGSELVRQILRHGPRQVVLFEASELALYQLARELDELPQVGTTFVPVLGSVTDEAAVRRVMAEHAVNVVLHAAAYKHVPLVEQNQLAGLKNNVLGTQVVAELCRELGVAHMLLVSTDKAVSPTNVMGASKRFAEHIVQDLATRAPDTCFAIVRFGNVLGSSGSVVPLFAEQIERGGPVTLTHPDVTRFFMTTTEAARLVLMAGTLAADQDESQNGSVFVLDMGPPVPVKRLATQMITAAGFSVRDAGNPGGDIEIEITGLRPGEKLHEELTINTKSLEGTRHPKILKAAEPQLSEIEVAAALKGLNAALAENDDGAAREVLRRWLGARTTTPAITESVN